MNLTEEPTFVVKNLKVLDVVDVYVKGLHEYGRGVVVHTYTSGGNYGARVVGTTGRLNETFDIHVRENQSLLYVYPRRTIGAGQEVEDR